MKMQLKGTELQQKSRLAEKTRLVDKKIEILQNGDISFSVNR